jgi:hypothetical protein
VALALDAFGLDFAELIDGLLELAGERLVVGGWLLVVGCWLLVGDRGSGSSYVGTSGAVLAWADREFARRVVDVVGREWKIDDGVT